VHWTLGIPRHFQAFSWLRVFSCSQAEFTPAPAPVTQTVGRFAEKDHRVVDEIRKIVMQPINDGNRKREIRQRLQPLMDEYQRTWNQGNAQASRILRRYGKNEFNRKYNTILTNVISKIIYEDVGIVIRAIAESVKSIKPDETVGNSRYVTERLMRKAMWATTSSIKYIFAKRRKFSSNEIQLSSSAAQQLTEGLNGIIAGMTAQDSAILLGKLSGIYFKTCPKESIRVWMESKNENPNSLFTTWALEGELLMTIDY